MNLDWNKTTSDVTEYKRTLQTNKMVNVMEKQIEGTNEGKIHTYQGSGSGGGTWLDHGLASQSLMSRGAVTGAAVDTGKAFYQSDHRLCGLTLNITKMIGRITTLSRKQVQLRPRTLKCTDKKLKQAYIDEIEHIDNEEGKKGHISIWDQINKIYDEAMQHKRTQKGMTKQMFRRRANRMMGKLVMTLLKAETRVAKKLEKFQGDNKRDYWSNWMSHKQSKMHMLKALLKKGRVKTKRNKVNRIIAERISAQDKSFAQGLLKKCPKISDTNGTWDKWNWGMQKKLKTMERTCDKRRRRKHAMEMKKKIRIRLTQWRQNRKLGSFLKYAVGKVPNATLPTTLVEYGPTGMTILDTPTQVKEKNMELTISHMGKDREKWFLHNGMVLDEFRRNKSFKSKWMKLLTKKRKTNTEQHMNNIPERLKEVFETGKLPAGITPAIYGDVFTSPVSLQTLDRYLGKKKKNTAPGVSGIRIDHVAALPDKQRRAIAHMLSLPYIAGVKYGDWKRGNSKLDPKNRGQ